LLLNISPVAPSGITAATLREDLRDYSWK